VSDASGTSNLAAPESAGELRRMRLRSTRLYFVCEALPRGQDPEALLNATMGAGVLMVELRDREQPKGVIERSGRTFRRLANTFSALFIVNDDPYLAMELSADGVHVGQEDMDPAEARRIIGPDAIIGLSTHSREQIEAAGSQPVDYISVGPIWETPTKEGRPATGLELIQTAAEVAQMPWFAIGGIDPSNVDQVVEAGAERLCVVRAIRDARDPREATTRLFAAVDPAEREESRQ
jgi:thiamine-phosphate diphosphorylase